MTPERFQQIAAIFREAYERSGPEREAYLDRACADDETLRRDVVDLLEADAAARTATNLTEREPNGSMHAAGPNVPVVMPERIGRYRVRQMLDEGGMGRTYIAVQEHPRRTVALKVMKSAIASKSALRRFEYESQILARLRHPNIVQVFEAGVHEEGAYQVPYFAMEYVPGSRPITAYAREKRLGTRERLAMFATVCDAIHHGHQKGVIHRDLKPANLLVNSAGEPKVIDFGVARSIDSDQALTTLQTDVGQLVGTVQYMSPEQCAADPHDLDTRSDVYALGVVLYELLTDSLPYDIKSLALHDALRVVLDQAPTRPSSLDRTLRGDVETITMKTLAKERERRYQSAGELGEDVRRFLRGEPITARSTSTWYVIRKAMARRRAHLAVAAAILLLVTLAGVSWARAQSLVKRSETAAIFMLMDAEEVGNPYSKFRPTPKQVAWVEQDLNSGRWEEEEEARLRTVLGLVHIKDRNIDAARVHLNRALELRRGFLEPPHVDLAESLCNVARIKEIETRYPEAAAMYEQAVQMVRAVHGEGHAALARGYAGLAFSLKRQGRYEEAAPYFHQVLDMRRKRYGDESLEVFASKNNLAVFLRDRGRFDEAEPLFRETVRGFERLDGYEDFIFRARRNIALCELYQGRTERARAELEAILNDVQHTYDAGHAELGSTHHALAVWHLAQGALPAAEQHGRLALEIRNANWPRTPHVRRADSAHLLARILIAEGDVDEALHRWEEAQAQLETLGFASGHPRHEMMRATQASLLLAQGKPEQARRTIDAVIARQEKLLAARHPELQWSLDVLHRTLLEQGDEARALVVEQRLDEMRLP